MLHLLPTGVYENGILRHTNVDMKMLIIIGLWSLGAMHSEKTVWKQYFINVYELASFLFPDDPPVPSNYELLKLPDVGLRSVYSGLSPYVNTGGECWLNLR